MTEAKAESSILKAIATECWQITAEMAPYLIFGFAIAGLLHLLIRQEWVERFLGRPGLGGVVKGSLIGVPMPLCSCSVIPVAASLRDRGASRGATASFLSSTPQTGVDSILATYALMGGLFTTVRVIVAFVSGIVSGLLVEWVTAKHPLRHGTAAAGANPLAPQPVAAGMTFSAITPESSSAKTERGCCGSGDATRPPKFLEAMHYGFITLPRSIAGALLLGLLLAGLIGAYLPSEPLQGAWSSGALAFLMATAISVPLYVCATASIPMAFALITAGLSPGAALVFLITGPATNTATIATVVKMLGKGATIVYLSSLIVVSWIAGWIMNQIISAEAMDAQIAAHEHALPMWQHLSGILLVLLLLYVIIGKRWPRFSKRPDRDPCCQP